MARLDRPITLAAALNAVDDTPVVVTIPPKLTVDERSYAFRSNGEVKTVTWAAGDVAKTETMLGGVYEARKTLQFLPDILLEPQRPADVAVALAHAWHYETALGLAECYHALGDVRPPSSSTSSRGRYEFLNAEVEAPYVWGAWPRSIWMGQLAVPGRRRRRRACRTTARSSAPTTASPPPDCTRSPGWRRAQATARTSSPTSTAADAIAVNQAIAA